MAYERDAPTRQDTWQVRFQFDAGGGASQIDWGNWDKKTGGEVDSDETKFNPGAMENPISLGGKRNVGNVTLQRLYDRVEDHNRIITLMNGVGRTKCIISIRPMDFDGNASTKVVLYHGILKRVSMPDHDSEGTGPALLEIEMTVNGLPTWQ